MNIATIDIIFGSLVLILAVRCALKGFLDEFLSMAGIVLGVLAAVLLFKPGAAFVRDSLGWTVLPELIAFVALFLIVFIVVKIVEKLVGDIVEKVNLTGLDRAFGVLLGLVEGLLVVSVVLFILSIQPLFDPAALLERSLFAKYLMPLVSLAGESAAAAVKGK